MKFRRLSRDHRLLLFSMGIAALFLLIHSKSSPLYAMNDWVDVHCFFTMGRGILDGQVPYMDLYEQKGPVLYFLYALAALISRDTFWGVFILEVICFGLFLYLSGKLAQVYLGQCKVIYWIIVVLGALIPISAAFSHGSSAEGLCLFMLVYGLYSVTRAAREERALTFTEAFLNGIFASMVLWIKFTGLGFYLGLALYILISYMFPKPQWKQLGITVGGFLLGIAAVSAVVFAYFLYHGAVADLIEVYFYNNIFLYPVEAETEDVSRIELYWQIMVNVAENNAAIFTMIGIGALGLLADIRKHWRILLAAVLSFLVLVVGTYWGMRPYPYYAFVFAAFSVYGPIAVIRLLRLLPLDTFREALADSRWLQNLAILSLTVAMFAVSFTCSRNAYMMRYAKEDYPQYKFAQIINTVEDPQILNYGFLDSGFYYAAGVKPSCRYFCYFNINVPQMWNDQRDAIESGEVDFVITRRYTLDRYSPDTSDFTLVSTADFYYSGIKYTYYLYQRG